MGIMPDSWIRKMAQEQEMINPFVEDLVKAKCFILRFVILWI